MAGIDMKADPLQNLVGKKTTIRVDKDGCIHQFWGEFKKSQKQPERLSVDLQAKRGAEVPKISISYDKKVDAYDLTFSNFGKTGWTEVQGVIAIIKATIPVSDRAYNPVTKAWSVSAKYYNPILELVTHVGFIIDHAAPAIDPDNFFYDSTPVPTQTTKESLQVKLMTILEVDTATFNNEVLLKKAYRRKALELHPDRNNGDGSRMSELNSLWSQLNATS